MNCSLLCLVFAAAASAAASTLDPFSSSPFPGLLVVDDSDTTGRKETTNERTLARRAEPTEEPERTGVVVTAVNKGC